MCKEHLYMLLIVIASFALSFYFFPKLPDTISTHWGLSGFADGFSQKDFISVYGLSILIGFVALLLYAIPKFDPLRKNIDKFYHKYNIFSIVFLLYLLYVQVLIITYNLGWIFNFGQLMMPALALLFYYIGIMIESAKPNWFIGIRTPWTLSSERVWEKTHAIGGKLFKAAGIACLIGLFMPEIGFIVLIGMIIAIVVFSFVYSYLEFEKEKKKENKGQVQKTSRRKRNN